MEDSSYHTPQGFRCQNLSYHQQCRDSVVSCNTSGQSLFFEGQLVVGNCVVVKVGGEKLSGSSACWDWFTHKDKYFGVCLTSIYCSVRGSRLKLLEVGWRTGVSGIVVQMYTALITTLKRDRTFRRIRVRSPRGPPRANCALSSSPHTK